jgi:hypothetical protein
MRNLEALNIAGDMEAHFIKLEIHIDESFLEEALKALHSMNLNRATLFPRLDGFAKHLEMLIAIPKTIA